jgi:zinc and cadmium transporter
MPTLVWIIAACVAGGLLSVMLAAVVAFRIQARLVPMLVSYAVGALLGAVFLDILPHLFEKGDPATTAAFILLGLLIFFVMEKLLLWRHHHGGGEEGGHGHGHSHSHSHVQGGDGGRSGLMIVYGDAFHNFTDGVIIAGAFLADVKIGIVTSLAIVAHEIPSEIGDFLVLLHSGYTKSRALMLNAISSVAGLGGGLLGYFALSAMERLIPALLAIAAAGMMYVAVADLIPGLHRGTRLSETATQVAFIGLGIGTIWAVLHLLGH